MPRILNFTFISSQLTTRVTTTPAILGEFRSMIKVAAAFTFTDDAPAAAPSTADGMRIFSKNHATVGTAGETNKWAIFVGANKIVKPVFFQGSGRAGLIETDRYLPSTIIERGIRWVYDDVTGVVVLDAGTNESSGITTRQIGYQETDDLTASSTVAADCFFDIFVEEQ